MEASPKCAMIRPSGRESSIRATEPMKSLRVLTGIRVLNSLGQKSNSTWAACSPLVMPDLLRHRGVFL